MYNSQDTDTPQKTDMSFVRRFFNDRFCLELLKTQYKTKIWTIKFSMYPMVKGKTNFQDEVSLSLLPDELTKLGRFLITRNVPTVEFPYHNGNTLGLKVISNAGGQPEKINISIRGTTTRYFDLDISELFTVTGLVVNTLSAREGIDPIGVITLYRAGF
jgi:hypothetical protein